MKKLTLIFATMLIGLASATAAEKMTISEEGKDLGITKRYRYTQPIMFVERGVEFLVFPNGEFDFNTEIVNGPFNDDYYYRGNNLRRRSINATFGAPGTRSRYSRPRGTIILHDRSGKVRRIGNVFINYDRRDRVKRVGSVYMQYRHGRLKQVGGLTIQYNRFGDMIGTHGFVNRHNQGCGFCGVTGCSADHFGGHDDFNDGWFDNDDDDDWDDDYYYYRQDGKKKKRKKLKKRKKYRIDD